MEQVKTNTGSEVRKFKNPIVQMIEDKKRIVKAIENGESLSTLKGIKIVSPI
ncbi:MAG: hypothetical protein ACHQIM_19370 [Sphingobacteriales bacterium]